MEGWWVGVRGAGNLRGSDATRDKYHTLNRRLHLGLVSQSKCISLFAVLLASDLTAFATVQSADKWI